MSQQPQQHAERAVFRLLAAQIPAGQASGRASLASLTSMATCLWGVQCQALQRRTPMQLVVLEHCSCACVRGQWRLIAVREGGTASCGELLECRASTLLRPQLCPSCKFGANCQQTGQPSCTRSISFCITDATHRFPLFLKNSDLPHSNTLHVLIAIYLRVT